MAFKKQEPKPQCSLIIFDNREKQKKWDEENGHKDGSYTKGRPPMSNAKITFEVDLKDEDGNILVYAGTELESGLYLNKSKDGLVFKKGNISATKSQYKKLEQTFPKEKKEDKEEVKANKVEESIDF